MNTSFQRTFNAVCAAVVLALLTACGSSSSVVDPLKSADARVIGLGDGYNDVGYNDVVTGSGDSRYTVRSLANNSAGSSVVEQLAVMLGNSSTAVAITARQSLPTSGVFSYASGTSQVSGGVNSLRDQVTNLISDVGGSFGSSDLIVIAAGSVDLKAGTAPQTITDQISAAAQQLINAQAKYVLILVPLDLSTSPGGGSVADSAALSSDLRVAADSIDRSLARTNTVLLADVKREFNLLTIGTTFTDITSAYCVPRSTTGCIEIAGNDYSTLFFADDYHLTPAGNLWIAQQLYTKTGTASWR